MASAKVGLRGSMMDESLVCYRPNHITSTGMEYLHKSESILEYSLPLLMLQVGLIFAITRTLHFLLKPLCQPMLVSNILAGIILGPSVLGANQLDVLSGMFHEKSTSLLYLLAMIGCMFCLFLLGVKMDLTMIWKSGRKSIAIGVLGVIIPTLLGMAVAKFLVLALSLDPKLTKGLNFGSLTLAKTTFPVIATLLTELNMLNSELGRLALSSSIPSELINFSLSVTISTARLSSAVSQQKIRFASMFLGSFLSFVSLIVFVVPRVMRWMIRQTQEGKPVKEIYIFSILMAVMISAFISHVLGLHVISGPFLLGMAVPDGPPLGSALVNKIETFTTDFMMPLFLATSGLKTDLRTILDLESLVILLVLIIFIFLGKFAGIMLPSLYYKIPVHDSLTLTFIMSSKGLIELTIFTAFLESQIMDTKLFSIMVTSVVVVAGIVTPLVKTLYDPSRKYVGYNDRTIQYSKQDAELRILACIHEQDNVPTIIKLLEASNPTKENPICVCVLNFIELVGRAAPILISHQLPKRNKFSSDEHVINTFQEYEQQNKGRITVKAFTAISPPNSMHDDVCILSLDKRTSLIILPFHKICFDYGTMSSGKSTLRNLNLRVLDTAPCSVGILVDRWHLSGSTLVWPMESIFRVAVLFLGGADDREALAYSKRMAEKMSVRVTIVRLIASTEKDVREWEKMLDAEAIKDFKFNTLDNERVVYIEEEVKDVVQTAWIIHSMEYEFDLIMVGRRYGMDSPLTLGLNQWSECPELGSIGDMLASSDTKSGISVLVVQQQKR